MASGIVFLPSYYEAIRPLPDQERLMMYDAILDYGLSGVEPDGLPPILAGYFALLRPNIDSTVRRYDSSVKNGKKGGRPKKPTKNPRETQPEPIRNLDKEKDLDKDSEMDKDCKADKPPRTHFAPPSVDDVRAYCLERKNGVDPQRFVDYYQARGWKLGKESMKDWKAAVRTWERKERGHGTAENRDSCETAGATKRWNIQSAELD